MKRRIKEWLEYITRQHWQSVDMGLERMQVMTERLALERPAPRVVTVAGTNGKGSTSVACEQLLLSAGLSVGCTLSPHVARFNERIRVGGRELDDAATCRALEAVEAVREDLPLTYFEYSILAALWTFRQAGVDVAVLEIGLGGRLDAVNVVDADVAVITSIGLDHQILLGDTLESIGREKAGILRSGQHVVLGPDMPATVTGRCAELGLSPLRYGVDFCAEPARGGIWHLSSRHASVAVARNLPASRCAAQNLALAWAAAGTLTTIRAPDLARVGREFDMPGRMERREWAGRTLLLDVAHNPAGVAFLVEHLVRMDCVPDLVVCGMLAGKDHAGVRAAAAALSGPWILAGTLGDRAMSAAALAGAMSLSAPCVDPGPDLARALLSASTPGDVILVFGSFSIVEQCSFEDGLA